MNKFGFGITQVLIAALLVGVFATIFVQKIGGQARVSLISELIRYRNYVLNYYSSIAANRASWEQTKGSVIAGSAAEIMDTTSGNTAIPVGGLGLDVGEDLPAGTIGGCSGKAFCVTAKAGLIQPNNDVPIEVTVAIDSANANTSFDVPDAKRVIWLNIQHTPGAGGGASGATTQDCSVGDPNWSTNPLGRYEYTGTGAPKGVYRYAGDAAVIGIDSSDNSVKCSDQPLVIPPCHDLTDDAFLRPGNVAFDPDDLITYKSCRIGTPMQGRCPITADGGQTAMVSIDPQTGIVQCSKQFYLFDNTKHQIEGSFVVGTLDCSSGGTVPYRGLQAINRTGMWGECWSINRGGVEVEPPSGISDYIRGWEEAGAGRGSSLGHDPIHPGPPGRDIVTQSDWEITALSAVSTRRYDLAYACSSNPLRGSRSASTTLDSTYDSVGTTGSCGCSDETVGNFHYNYSKCPGNTCREEIRCSQSSCPPGYKYLYSTGSGTCSATSRVRTSRCSTRDSSGNFTNCCRERTLSGPNPSVSVNLTNQTSSSCPVKRFYHSPVARSQCI